MNPLFQTREDWYKSKDRVDEFAKLLADPTLLQALTVLKDEQAITASKGHYVTSPATGALAEYSLQRQSYTSGYFDCLRDLVKLGTMPKPHEPPAKQREWGQYQSEQ